MDAQRVFEELHTLEKPVPRPLPLPTEQQIAQAESRLGVTFPPSFRVFELEHSNINAGDIEPLVVTAHGPINIVEAVESAWNECGVPRTLLPFAAGDGGYFCFDLGSKGEEKSVVQWTHESAGITDRWDDFATWIKSYWIGELSY